MKTPIEETLSIQNNSTMPQKNKKLKIETLKQENKII